MENSRGQQRAGKQAGRHDCRQQGMRASKHKPDLVLLQFFETLCNHCILVLPHRSTRCDRVRAGGKRETDHVNPTHARTHARTRARAHTHTHSVRRARDITHEADTCLRYDIDASVDVMRCNTRNRFADNESHNRRSTHTRSTLLMAK
jgi:hypothetical protein